ncbi:ATP-binding protein [Thalassotalea piscium]|uniref:histidine kinase n=1 Tax=Thalassotalea piscium TaxID=1230533 RepID=A0A7X0NE20_9GAMM|nr:ATP-binding protein [Thalassotalea piscium]MBB6541720.1 PAS domain S-box-containing protein [Thalassotalea piscium]
MLNIKSKNQLVSSYHTSIILVFFVLVLTAFVLAWMKYTEELDLYKENQYLQLNKEMLFLNNVLSQSVNALAGMRDFANYYLDNPTELAATLPTLVQDKERFYLKRAEHDVINYRQPLNVNITGVGQLSSLTPEVKQELIMAHALAPAFISAEKSNTEANWFYYVSFSKFISLYPWINRDTWQYSARTTVNPHMQSIKQAVKREKKFYWSIPYDDAANKGLSTALGAAVFRGDKVAGAVVIDISLGKIHEKLTSIDFPDHGLAIIDKNDNVLVHKTLGNNKINANSNKNKHPNLPSALTNLAYQQFFESSKGIKVGHYFVQHIRVPVNDWVIVKYQPYADVVQKVTGQFINSLFLSIFALLVLLTIIYFVTRRTFIKPTQQFISHIEHSAKGDHGKVKPPKGWAHWFQLVEDIFSQNRSLLQQLKDQNKVLDLRVNEKTQALREKSEQHQHDYAILRSVMDAIPDFLIFNDLNHRVIGCNLAFEKLVGVSESKILGGNAGELLPNELGQLLNSKQHSNINGRGTINVIETLENTYEVLIEQFYNSEKVLLGTIVIIRDVTERTAITSALEQAKVQAEKANLAKSQFLANMSHEIRTPINAIQGMHFLLTQSGLTSGQKIHLDNAEVASMSLLHLVDELLDLAKIESGNMTIVKASSSVDRIVNQAIKLNIGTALHKDLTVNVDIKHNVPQQVMTDEMRLVQVLSNLLNNAVKFTAKGKIQVVIENTAQEDKTALVKFSVKDTGIGIAKEKQTYLFDAFRQADESMTRQYGGSGLGLSICREIVDLLGGDITINSDINQGAEFSFVLPLSIDTQSTNRLALETEHAFVSVATELPDCFPTNLALNHHSFLKVEQLADIVKHPKLATSLPLVIFIDTALLDTQKFDQITALITNSNVNVSLFVLCQNSYKVPNSSALSWFDKYQLPYTVCEQPIYRYCLLHVFDELRNGVNNNDVRAFIPKLTDSESIAPEPKADLSGITVMLVEDNLVNQLVAKELLVSMQAEVIIADNGQIALDLLSQAQQVDVILMDIQMPVMDGLTTAHAIRKNPKYADLPIIAMTAHAQEEDRKQSFDAGMNMHIAKPVKADLLLNSILSFFDKT